MGLLSKASFISDIKKTNVELAFSEFVFKYNIRTFAIFRLSNDYYSVENSIGFDGISLISSLSTKDFWDGICPKIDKEYIFPCDNVTPNPLIQFFSFAIRDNIKSISIYRNEKSIFMLCNKCFDANIINDMAHINSCCNNVQLENLNKTITSNSKVFMYEVDFSEAVDYYISEKQRKHSLYIKLFKTSLYNELINRFSCYFTKYGVKRISENTIRVLLNVDKSIHEKHVISHIVFILSNVIGDCAKLISFKKSGIAVSLIDIKDFLQVD